MELEQQLAAYGDVERIDADLGNCQTGEHALQIAWQRQ